MLDSGGSTGAYISDCEKYRYALWRNWDNSKAKCAYIMLNPSTADATNDDATITRCITRAKALNFGGIVVANLFAFRTTYPTELVQATNPVGEENDAYLLHIAKNAGMVICAWGNDGTHQKRNEIVMRMFRAEKIPLFHLGLTQDGNPLHPLARGKSMCIPYVRKPYLWS